MFLSQLFEAIDKRHAAFCFGRMNPPTLGHKQLADTVARAAAGGDYFIFTSQTQDPKKNPLDYATKVKFLKGLMPEHAGHIIQDPSLKTIIQIAHWLYAKGYRSVTFVAGSDRIDGFKELLNKYNGVEGANGYYQFDTINIVSSGDRDPDGEGLAGISATAAREAAKAGNLEAFAQATGAGELATQLFQAVRKGMLIESRAHKVLDTWFKNQERQQKFSSGELQIPTPAERRAEIEKQKQKNKVKEEASGYIPKNKKEAKDPRWSNALSVDVTPETPAKNARAFRLI